MMDEKIVLLREILQLHQYCQSEAQEVFELVNIDTLGREKLFSSLTSWSHWYSLSHIELTMIAANLMGVHQLLKESSMSEDRFEANLRFASKVKTFEASLDEVNEVFGEEQAKLIVLQILFALHYSQQAISRRNRSINCMLAQIRKQVDDYQEIIFEAVSIDPTVVTNPELANIIARWTVENNEEYLTKLSKALIGKYPRGKRDADLDEHRYMTNVLEEFTDDLRAETIDEMNQVLNLLQEGEDPIEAIKYHLRIRKRDTRGTKRDSSS